MVTKVSYTLNYNGTSLKPSDIMYLNPNLLQGAIAVATLSQNYTVLEDSEADVTINYDNLFSLTLGRPPLDVDRAEFQKQLQQAWINYKNGKIFTVYHTVWNW